MRDFDVDFDNSVLATKYNEDGLWSFTAPSSANFRGNRYIVTLPEAMYIEAGKEPIITRVSDSIVLTRVDTTPTANQYRWVQENNQLSSHKVDTIELYLDDAGEDFTVSNFWSYGSIIHCDTFLRRDIPEIITENIDFEGEVKINNGINGGKLELKKDTAGTQTENPYLEVVEDKLQIVSEQAGGIKKKSILLNDDDSTIMTNLTQFAGENYSWVDETANRNINVTYTNTYGKPIMVVFAATGQEGIRTLEIDGVVSRQVISNECLSIVPVGSTYKFYLTGGSYQHCRELK